MVVVVDLEKGTTEEPMGGAPDAQLPVPAMAGAGGGEMNLLIGDLSRLLLAEHMPDLEKGIKEKAGMYTHHAGQVPAVAEDEEHERLILKDLRYHLQVEGGAVAGNKKMNPGQKKWLPYYWLLVAAASVILLNNHIHAAPKDQPLFLPELAVFTVLLSSICLIFLSVKQMM